MLALSFREGIYLLDCFLTNSYPNPPSFRWAKRWRFMLSSPCRNRSPRRCVTWRFDRFGVSKISEKKTRKKAVTTLGVSMEVMVTIVSICWFIRHLGDLQATYIGVIIHLLRLLFLFVFCGRCFGYTWDHPSVTAAMDGNGRLIGIPYCQWRC